MRVHRGHFTANTESIKAALKRHGKNEMKFRSDNLWRKVVNDKVIAGPTRKEVRNIAKNMA